MSESPFAPPSVDDRPPAFEPTLKTEIPLGPRVAGGVLIGNALLSLVSFATLPDQMPGGVVSIAIDAVIGGSLIAGKEKFLVWAKLRVVLGLVLYSVVNLGTGDYYSALFQIVFSIALIGLLFGNPGAARIGVSAMTSVVCMVTATIGLMGGSVPFLNPYLGQLEEVAGGRIDRADYQLAVPSEWKLRKPEFAVKDNPVAEVWLVHAPSDSHVLVIAERLDQPIDLEGFQQNVLTNLRAAASDVVVERIAPSTGGVTIRSHGNVPDAAGSMLELDYIHRLVVDGSFGAQVVAFGPKGNLAPDIETIVDSFSH
jgi:hypothetical protein